MPSVFGFLKLLFKVLIGFKELWEFFVEQMGVTCGTALWIGTIWRLRDKNESEKRREREKKKIKVGGLVPDCFGR